jgi:hypothetical protein
MVDQLIANKDEVTSSYSWSRIPQGQGEQTILTISITPKTPYYHKITHNVLKECGSKEYHAIIIA